MYVPSDRKRMCLLSASIGSDRLVGIGASVSIKGGRGKNHDMYFVSVMLHTCCQ